MATCLHSKHFGRVLAQWVHAHVWTSCAGTGLQLTPQIAMRLHGKRCEMLVTLAVIGILMVLLAVLLVSNTRKEVRQERAQNRAGGVDFDYTPDRSKH